MPGDFYRAYIQLNTYDSAIFFLPALLILIQPQVSTATMKLQNLPVLI
jgi:hypothetical protein